MDPMLLVTIPAKSAISTPLASSRSTYSELSNISSIEPQVINIPRRSIREKRTPIRYADYIL